MKSSISHILLLAAAVVFTLTGCRNEANLIPETCFDGIQNQGETAIDCGGPNCPACDPTCDDREQNQGEFSPVTATNNNVRGIDCGGEFCEPCATCDDGIRNAHWVRDANLTTADLGQDSVGIGENGNLYRLVMERGIDCGFPCDTVCEPTCDDGILNGLETNVDCGGPDCPPCTIPPNCNDGVQNGLETGIDCGSPECPVSQQACPDPTCNDGIQNIHIEVTDIVQEGYILVIEAGIDCDNNPNTSCPDCPAPTCFDGVRNQGEEGIDCGGPCITECWEEPSCHDGVMNGDETGIDCGGEFCPPCPTCSDGFKNGPELNIDCVDYPIPQYLDEEGNPCRLCDSCHDELQTEELFEFDVDCGGQCEPCDQYLEARVSNSNVAGTGQGFLDQFTYNGNLAAQGQSDTLFVPNALEMSAGRVAAGNNTFWRLRAIQRINVPNSGTFERVFEVLIEGNITDHPAMTVLNIIDMGGQGQQRGTTVRYREGFIDGQFEATTLYESVPPIVPFDDPVNSNLTVDYNYSNEAGGLIRGRINFVRLQEVTFGGPDPGYKFARNIEFAIQYLPSFGLPAAPGNDLDPPLLGDDPL